MLSTSTSSVSLYAPGLLSIVSPGTHRSSAAWIDSPGLMRNTAGWRWCSSGFKDPSTAADGITPAWAGFKDPPTAAGEIAFACLGFKDPPTAVGGFALAGLGFKDPSTAVGGIFSSFAAQRDLHSFPTRRSSARRALP